MEKIIEVINEILSLTQEDNPDELKLLKYLNKFLYKYLELDWNLITSSSIETVEPPNEDYQQQYKLLGSKFKNFGYYNTTLNHVENIGSTEIGVGDAVDDLVDFISGLKEILWVYENINEKEAKFYLTLGFTSIWGEHLVDLIGYIYRIHYK